MSQSLASKSAIRSPQPSATANVFSRQVQSPPPPPPATQAQKLKTVQFQQANMPYMSGVQGSAIEPEPWFSRTTNYCCYLPFWAGAIIWTVAGLMTVGIFIFRIKAKNPDQSDT